MTPVAERVNDVTGFNLHYYGNKYHRVPEEWRFPRCGTHDLWRQWWVGDSVRHIPPLKFLVYEDVKHINLIPLSDLEKQRKVGPYKENRKRVTKVLSDMKKLCTYINELVRDLGKWEDKITLGNIDKMFAYVAPKLITGKFF